MSYTTFKSDYKDKNVLVFGLGLLGGGVSVVKIFDKIGANLRVTDKKTKKQLHSSLEEIKYCNVESFTLEKHTKKDIDWADVIIKNPSVPSDSSFIQYAKTQKKHVTTQTALYLLYTEAFTIGITGTRGKTTTTMMTYEILKSSFPKKILLGGNIQDKGSLSLLSQEKKDSIVVLELSSWELEGCHREKVSPNIAVITNLYEDHLNRYDSIDSYAHDKAAVFAYQKKNDIAFLSKKNKWNHFFKKYIQGKHSFVDESDLPNSIQLSILGKHNRMNAAFAYTIAQTLKVNEDNIQTSLKNFPGVAYRQENKGTFKNITFINDATSTTPTALLAALQTYPHATCILGGTTKHLPLDDLVDELSLFRGNLVFLKGSGTKELLVKMNTPYKVFGSLKSAFIHALDTVELPGIIVFSPGFTSFEMFRNEFDRAEQFDRLVNNFASNT